MADVKAATPRPWKLATGSLPTDAKHHAIIGPPVEQILARVEYGNHPEANARLIVEAVNLYDLNAELVTVAMP